MSGVTINVNGLSLVHEDSGGVSTATLPDVCVTPPTFAPVPYPNVARSRDLVNGSSLVRADGGHRIAIAGSALGRSTGDEPGAGGGVTSGVRGKEATWLSYSFDVEIEGRGACRHTDKMLHNRGNTLDCAGHQNPPVAPGGGPKGGGSGKVAGARRHKTPPWETHLRPTWFGVDTNAFTLHALHIDYAKHRHCTFVCRYLTAFPDTGTSDGVHPGLTHEEAHWLGGHGMDLVAIWEMGASGDDQASRAVVANSLHDQKYLGLCDGRDAAKQMREVGGHGKPIYFTIDFKVTQRIWNEKFRTDTMTGKQISRGELIVAYFEGINKALGRDSHDGHRTGVYGRYTAVKELFDLELVRYGWQMTFNHKPHPRAQLYQYTVYPDITRWGPDPTKMPLGSDAQNAAAKAALAAYEAGLQKHWGVSGAGGLDFDRAVKEDFGQWHPR